MIAIAGCGINIGSGSNAKFQRTDELQSPLKPGSTVIVKTSFGSINIHADAVTQCFVSADITLQAPTKSEAEQIAEKVSIGLERRGNKLNIKVNKPRVSNNRSVAVSFDITVPRQTDIKCDTSYGSIKLAGIGGNISAKTSFAAITANDLNGIIALKTSYGSITGRNITSSKFDAHSSFGSINIDFSNQSPSDLKAKLNTSYGSITVAAPPDFTGQVDLVTSFGSTKTDLPLTVTGELSGNRITGQIGQGTGELDIKTSFGAINVRLSI